MYERFLFTGCHNIIHEFIEQWIVIFEFVYGVVTNSYEKNAPLSMERLEKGYIYTMYYVLHSMYWKRFSRNPSSLLETNSGPTCTRVKQPKATKILDSSKNCDIVWLVETWSKYCGIFNLSRMTTMPLDICDIWRWVEFYDIDNHAGFPCVSSDSVKI